MVCRRADTFLSPDWHGFAMQDARLCLEGVSPALRAGRVTLKDPPLWQITPKSSPQPNCPLRGFPRLVQRVGRSAADGTLAYAIPGFGQSPLRTSLLSRRRGRAVLALIRFGPYVELPAAPSSPDGAPDPLNSTRRFAGTNTVLPVAFSIHVGRLFRRRRAVQGLGKQRSGI